MSDKSSLLSIASSSGLLTAPATTGSGRHIVGVGRTHHASANPLVPTLRQNCVKVGRFSALHLRLYLLLTQLE